MVVDPTCFLGTEEEALSIYDRLDLKHDLDAVDKFLLRRYLILGVSAEQRSAARRAGRLNGRIDRVMRLIRELPDREAVV